MHRFAINRLFSCLHERTALSCVSALGLCRCVAGSSFAPSGQQTDASQSTAGVSGAATMSGLLPGTAPGSGSSRLIGGATLDPNLFWPPSGQDCEAKLNAGGNVPVMAS